MHAALKPTRLRVQSPAYKSKADLGNNMPIILPVLLCLWIVLMHCREEDNSMKKQWAHVHSLCVCVCVCDCVCRGGRQGRVERCSIGQRFWAVVISPEASEQVKGQRRGEGRRDAGWEGGRRRDGEGMCQRIMRNDTAVAGGGGGRFSQSEAQTRCTNGIPRLNVVALIVNTLTFHFKPLSC